MAVDERPTKATEPQLSAGALGLPAVVMQAVSHIGPAVGFFLSIQFITGVAGLASPVSFTAAFVIVLLLGLSLTELARRIPSAGGYFTYVSRTVGPRAGFLTAWLFFLYEPLGVAINFAWLGGILETTLKAEYGFTLPWWIVLLAGVSVVTTLTVVGVKVSARALVLLGGAEILMIVALAISGLISPGDGGINLTPFDPGSATDLNGLYLGVVFAIFGLTGFESVAPLAEETEDPRRNLPRAIIGAIIAMGIYYIFCSWAILVGWGTSNVSGFVDAGENPILGLAHRLWGGAWVILLLALTNSVLAVSVAAQNAGTRVFFAMARAGALPATLARIHPRFHTPINAIKLQTLITLAIGIGGGIVLGPQDTLAFFGLVITLGLILVYSAGNLGVFRLYRGALRGEFSPWRHAVFPALSSAALVLVGYKSLNPLPDTPFAYAPLVVAGWLVAGIGVTFAASRGGRAGWLLRAGEIALTGGQPPAVASAGGRDLPVDVEGADRHGALQG